MVARAGFYALALGAVLVMSSGATLSDEAMAQDDAAVQGDVTAQDQAVDQPAPRQPSGAADRPAKSDLDQSAVRAAPVTPPRPTRTSTRGAVMPKLLGSYR